MAEMKFLFHSKHSKANTIESNTEQHEMQKTTGKKIDAFKFIYDKWTLKFTVKAVYSISKY